MKILIFIKRYPELIVAAFILLLIGFLVLNNRNLKQENEALTKQVKVFQKDTTDRGVRQLFLEANVNHYQVKFIEVSHSLDSLKSIIIKANPGMATRFPSIESLKQKKQ